jgi:erythronate-4-phosphate dehydrogenase
LSALCDRLQIAWCAHDPPRAARESGYRSATLATVTAQDVVSVHVPLTRDGPWPTQNLVGPDIIAALRPATLVVNAARGGIVDEQALAARSAGAARLYAAIDCWAREPLLDVGVLERAWLATPHLAGQSWEARTNATAMLVAALARWLGARELPPLAAPLRLDADLGGGIDALLEQVYPLARHDRALRALGSAARALPATAFDALRRAGLRREFSAYRIACAGAGSDTVAELAALGFAPVSTSARTTPA